MNFDQARFVDSKIEQLLRDQCIKKLDKSICSGWISNIFLTPKHDGSFRLILNLKPLNQFIQYLKFKMDTIHNAVNMLHKSWYLASIDLKDTFSLLHMSHSHQKFLQFQWRGITYCYTDMPQGIAIGPITFVCTTKPLLAWLHVQGVHIMIYIDDTLICAESYEKLVHDVQITIAAFEHFGFVVNTKKSVLTPALQVDFLGFTLDTDLYKIILTMPKRETIFRLCENILQHLTHKISIRHLAKLIGKCVATFPASHEAQLHYRILERFKILRLCSLDWDAKVKLTRECLEEISWWYYHIFSHDFERSLHSEPIKFRLYVDSSSYRWGAATGDLTAQSLFDDVHKLQSINTKELLAIKFGLESFMSHFRGCHVLIFSDNMTAISAIKKWGSRNLIREALTCEIFALTKLHSITHSITHLSGSQKFRADKLSRQFNNCRTEWCLTLTSMELIKLLQNLILTCLLHI